MRQKRSSGNETDQAKSVPGFGSVTSILKNIAKTEKSIHQSLLSMFGSKPEITASEYFSLSVARFDSMNNMASKQYGKVKVLTRSVLAIQEMLAAYLEFAGVGKKIGKKPKPNQIPITETIRETSPIDTKPKGASINNTAVVDKLQELKEFLEQRFDDANFGTGKLLDIDGNRNQTKNDKILANFINSTTDYSDLITVVTHLESVLQLQVNILYSINSVLTRMYAYFPKFTVDTSELAGVRSQVSQTTDEFDRFIESLKKLEGSLNKDFCKRFHNLAKDYGEFVDEKNTKKLMLCSVQLTRFSWVLNKFAFSLRGARKVFRSLTASIITMAVALICPPFSIALALLFTIAKKLQTTFNPRFAFGFTRSMNAIRNVILGMVGAMILMNYVKTENMFKILGFVVLLGLVLQRFNKTNKGANAPVNINKISANNYSGIGGGIFGLCVGLALLTLVLANVDSINWGAAGMVLGFIGALGTILFIFGKKKIGRADIFKGMFQLSLGLAILVLTVDATTEVNWAGAAMVGGFIIALGIALYLQHKIAGKASFGGKLGLLGFAFGLSILILAIDAFTEIKWGPTLMMIGFITAVGFAVAAPSLLSKGGKTQPVGGLLGFAFGLAIIILTIDAAAELNFSAAWKVLAVIAGVTIEMIALSRFTKARILGANIKSMALLFAGATASIWLASKLVDKNSIVPVAIVFGTMIAYCYVARVVANNSKNIIAAGKLMPSIAEGLAIWMAVFWILDMLKVDLVKTATFIGGIGAIVGIYILMGKYKKQINNGTKVVEKMMPSLAMWAAGFFLINMVPVNLLSIATFCGSILLLSLVVVGLGMFDKMAKKGAATLLVISGAMVIASVAFVIINSMNLRLENFLTFGATVAVMSAIACILGIPVVAGLALLGTATLIAVSAGILIAALSIFAISLLPYNTENIENLGIAVGTLAKSLAVNTGWILLALPAAVMLIPVGAATMIFAGIFALTSLIPIKKENIQIFVESLHVLINEGYNGIGLGATAKALAKSVMLMPVAAASMIFAGIFALTSLIPIKTDNIKKFAKALTIVVNDGYNELGFFSTMKAAGKAVFMMPIAACSLVIAGAFKLISSMNLDEKKMETFGRMLTKFVDVFSDALDKNRKKLEGQKQNIRALAEMATASGSIINVIEQFANMKVGKWRYNDKKQEMEIYDYRELNDKDFDAVDKNMGRMIAALMKPLSTISSDAEWWDFGGIKVLNPFGSAGFFSPGNTSGVKRLEMVGNAFEKIPTIMQGLVNNQVLMDQENGSEKIATLTKNMGEFFAGMMQIVKDFEKSKITPFGIQFMAGTLNDEKHLFHNTMVAIANLAGEYKKSVFWSCTGFPHLANKTLIFEQMLLDAVSNYNKSGLYSSNVRDFGNFMESITKHQQKLFDAANGFLNSPFKTDGEAIAAGATSMSVFVGHTAVAMSTLSKSGIKGYDVNIGPKVVTFYKSMEQLTNNKWLTANSSASSVSLIAAGTSSIVNVLSDGSKFAKITKNLKNTANNVKEIVTNINKIDTKKAAALEKNLNLLTQAKSVEQLKQAVIELQKLIGMLVEAQKQQVVVTEKIEKKVPDKNVAAEANAQKKDLEAFGRMSASDKENAVNDLLYKFLIAIDTPKSANTDYAVPVDVKSGGSGGNIITKQDIIEAIKTAIAGQPNHM